MMISKRYSPDRFGNCFIPMSSMISSSGLRYRDRTLSSAAMASYLATLAIGEFDITSYRSNGISILDAIDTHLFTPPIVVDDGGQVAFSGAPANSSYKRLSHVITVPDDGATLAFDVAHDTDTNWDFFFVEVHTVGLEDWTTLPACA